MPFSLLYLFVFTAAIDIWAVQTFPGPLNQTETYQYGSTFWTGQAFAQHNPKCRFSPTFTQQEVLRHPDRFALDLLYWEGKFHQNNVSYNVENGMTYDGTLIDPTTGFATVKHPFSAASKEVGQPW